MASALQILHASRMYSGRCAVHTRLGVKQNAFIVVPIATMVQVCQHTLSHLLPLLPVCLVMSLLPIMSLAKLSISSALQHQAPGKQTTITKNTWFV